MDEHTVTERYRYLLVKFSQDELNDLQEWAEEHHVQLQDLAKQTLLDAVAS
jgi:hypothetical protein